MNRKQRAAFDRACDEFATATDGLTDEQLDIAVKRLVRKVRGESANPHIVVSSWWNSATFDEKTWTFSSDEP